MKKTLLVVDMQKGAALGRYHRKYLNRKWWNRYAEVTENILGLAQNVDEAVFVTDIRFVKKEHIEIVDALRQLADRSRQYFKTHCDGADALASQLDCEQEILIVGMNTDACILRTARGLKDREFTVKVIGDACWTAYAASSAQPHHHALHRIRKMGVPVLKTADIQRTRRQ